MIGLFGMSVLGAALAFSKEDPYRGWGDDPNEVVVPTVWEYCFREKTVTARGDDYGEFIAGCRFAWRWTPIIEHGKQRHVKVLRLVCKRRIYEQKIAECRK